MNHILKMGTFYDKGTVSQQKKTSTFSQGSFTIPSETTKKQNTVFFFLKIVSVYFFREHKYACTRADVAEGKGEDIISSRFCAGHAAQSYNPQIMT